MEKATRSIARGDFLQPKVDTCPLTRQAALGILALLGVVVLAGGVLITAAEPASFPNIARGYAWTVATLVTAGHTTGDVDRAAVAIGSATMAVAA